MVSSTDPTATPATSQPAPAPAATATVSSPAPPPGITTSAPDSQQPQQPGYPPNLYGNYPPPSPTPGGYAPPPQGYPAYPYPPQGAPPQGFYPPQPHYPQPPSPSQGGFPQYPPPGQQPYPYPPQQYPQQPGQPPQQYPPPGQYPPQPYQQYPPPAGYPQYPPPAGFPGYPAAPSAKDPSVYDPASDKEIIEKAFTGRKADFSAIIGVLTNRTPEQFKTLKPNIYTHSPAELTKLSPNTDDAVNDGVHALLYGPVNFYAFLIYTATNKKSGFGSSFKNQWMLSLALLGRKPEDVKAIKEAYEDMYGKNSLEGHLKKALGKKEETLLLLKLYENALKGTANPGVEEVDEGLKKQVQDAVDKEADELFTATVGSVEGEKFARIFATSSTKRLKDIQTAFAVRHKQKLYEVVDNKLKDQNSRLKAELLYMLDGLENRVNRDAKLLEETMEGFGTRDTKLMYRLIAAVWDKEHLTRVKRAYKARYPTVENGLVGRIGGDTSGSQQKFLVEIAKSDGTE